ncbi:MAG: putative drug exporter of the superfamily [Actinomycetota bacterium]|nr:putative drug exporter of the superfamily [Actinomycetota bacterium]
MFQALARVSYRNRRRVVGLWLLAFVGLGFLGAQLGGAYSQSFSLPGTESQRAADVLTARFPARAGDSGQIVFAARGGVRSATVQSRVEQLLTDVSRVPEVASVASPYAKSGASQIARDGSVAYATVQFDRHEADIATSTKDAIRTLVAGVNTSGAGVRVELGGRVFQQMGSLGPAELIGIVAAIVILLIAFGSVLAMGLPIMVALFGVGIGAAFVELLSHTISTPDFTTQLASMIGIGVGIDYALFIVTRYREALHDGLAPEAAVVRAIDTAGRAVVFAGSTVVISILGLFLMGVAFVRGLAVGTSVTVAVVMLASVTLLPAVLGFAGHTIDKLSVFRRRRQGVRTSIWYRWSRVVQHRPWPALAAGLIVLAVLAVPLFSIRLGFPDAGANPTSDTTRRAYDLVADGFGAGSNGPLLLAAEYPPGTDPTPVLGQLERALRATPDVAVVLPPVVSPTGGAAVVTVLPAAAPQSERSSSLVHLLRDHTIPAAVQGTNVSVHVGGLTAAGIDVSDRLAARLPLFIGAVLALSFLFLLAVFRSVLVPLKAVVMNVLSIGAAYGVIVAIFQWGWLGSIVGIAKPGPIAPFIPMMMFAILFGLSMDYEVFLLSRIREEYDRTGDNALAVADGLAATARVITAAALIMVTVFASFVFGDNSVVKLFGLGLAAAIFIDATVVRMVLVPATMELLGDLNWWFPRFLNRIPRLLVEPIDDVDDELAELLDHQPTLR